MKRSSLLVFLLAAFAGCSTYKELKPEPEIIPRERGYVELKADKENFKLERDKKYFMRFPRPERDKSYIVLTVTSKSSLGSLFSYQFDDGVLPNTKIPDEMPAVDSLLVFPVDTRAREYYWVIDTLRYNVELSVRYRYVARWRFTFENTYATFRKTLADSRVDRAPYDAIVPGYRFDRTDVRETLARLEVRTKRLESMSNEMKALETLFPPDVVGSRDTAYENYLLLRSDIDRELTFQQAYHSVLTLEDVNSSTQGNIAAFLRETPTVAAFFDRTDRYRPQVLEWGRGVVLSRLPEAVPFFENQIKMKADLQAFVFKPPLESVQKLYAACGRPVPGEFSALVSYVERFNMESASLDAARARLTVVDRVAQRATDWTSDSLYATLIANASAAQTVLSGTQIEQYDRGKFYGCTRLLRDEMLRTASKASGLRTLYEGARGVASQIALGKWPDAELRLRQLFLNENLASVPAVTGQHANAVSKLEDEIYSRVRQQSEQRVNTFVTRNETTIDNVAGLYADSAFSPVYQLTFSAGGSARLSQHRKAIEDYLSGVRHVRFPETAIRGIYREFVRDPGTRGVDRARAIAEHGKQYTGSDSQVRAMVDECTVEVPKWISKPKDYRKVYALPVTSNRNGTNEYMFRLLLKIPSDAEFPVFDVNVKLPKDLADKAGTTQWYKEITINKKPIKNEGRFRITAPTGANNYESLITPVQMDKASENILEVRFQYPGYRVFEISAMAQVPIIRKN